MGTLLLAFLEVSPSPVYGARLLSGLRLKTSRGFKSRHLRQNQRPGSDETRGATGLRAKSCVNVQCTFVWFVRLLSLDGGGKDASAPN